MSSVKALHARKAPALQPSTRCSATDSRCRPFRCRTKLRCKSASKDLGFDDKLYVQASVERVVTETSQGAAIILQLQDGTGMVLPVYIGDPESMALQNELDKKRMNRPATHDLMKNALSTLGYKVVLTRINALVGNTFVARMHLARADGYSMPVDIDARPSDAINMAVRFQAPLFVSKTVVEKMAVPISSVLHITHVASGPQAESDKAIEKSCKEECSRYKDPTIMKSLQLGLAVKDQRFEDASRLRDEIEHVMQQDLSLKLVIAIETALADGRFEEAARLRDELKARRSARERQTRDHAA